GGGVLALFPKAREPSAITFRLRLYLPQLESGARSSLRRAKRARDCKRRRAAISLKRAAVANDKCIRREHTAGPFAAKHARRRCCHDGQHNQPCCDSAYEQSEWTLQPLD